MLATHVIAAHSSRRSARRSVAAIVRTASWQHGSAAGVVAGVLCIAPLLFGGIAACGRAGQAGPIPWQALEAGFEHAHVEAKIGAGFAPVPMHLLRIDPRRFALEVVRAADLGRPLADAAAFRIARGGLAAINAGYFDPEYRPLGLLVSGGHRLSRLRKVDHGVFAIAGGRPSIAHARQFVSPVDLEFAVECGPRLIVDGVTLTFKRHDRARRVVIGHDSRDRVVIAVTAGVIRLEELSAFLVRPTEQGGPALQGALNLDGGSSTMLDLDANGVHEAIRSAVQVPVGLVVVGRGRPQVVDTTPPVAVTPTDAANTQL